eukprot:765868-Hanusia_phi.AAC.2
MTSDIQDPGTSLFFITIHDPLKHKITTFTHYVNNLTSPALYSFPPPDPSSLSVAAVTSSYDSPKASSPAQPALLPADPPA